MCMAPMFRRPLGPPPPSSCFPEDDCHAAQGAKAVSAATQHSTAMVAHVPELLLQIFLAGRELCTPDEFSSYRAVLLCVCHQWRELALNIAELWTSLSIPINRDIKLQDLHTRVRRSKHHPISVYISCDAPAVSYPFEVERARMAAIMQILIPQMHRWRSLEVHARYLSTLQTVGEMCNGTVPRLEVLSLLCQEWNPETIPVTLIGTPVPPFANIVPRALRIATNFAAPKPQRVAVAATTMLQNLLPAFRQTRELELRFDGATGEGIEPMMLMQNLGQYHRLTSLILRDQACHIPHDTLDGVAQPALLAGLAGGTRLDALQTLTIHRLAPQYACHVLRDMVTPVLEHVRIVGHCPLKIRPMLRMLAKRPAMALSSLTALSLEDLPFDAQLADALTYAPFCRHLRLQGTIGADFFEEMSKLYLRQSYSTDTFEDWVCPSLSSLDITSPTISVQSLRRLVLARYDSARELVTNPGEKYANALTELLITTHQTLSACDRTWFSSHVPTFRWVVTD